MKILSQHNPGDDDETTLVLTRREIALIVAGLYVLSPGDAQRVLHPSIKNRGLNDSTRDYWPSLGLRLENHLNETA